MRRHTQNQRGFTLLEVLIAVVVLAFGLLGVVAVFPAVIDVQRRAQDAVLGGSLAASAEAYVNASVLDSETLDWHEWEDQFDRRFPAREVLTNSREVGSMSVIRVDESNDTVELDFLWDLLLVEADGTLVIGGGEAAEPYRLASGGTPESNQALPTISFPVGDRLLPDEASGDAPRYVWDVLARRVDIGIGTALQPDRSRVEVPFSRLRELPVELMVVVRPIDRGIRVPVGLALRDTLRGYRLAVGTGGSLERDALPDRDRRFPVSAFDVDAASSRPGSGLDDNRVQYSIPVPVPRGRQLSADFTESKGSRLDLSRDIGIERRLQGAQYTLPSARRALAQVGQLFVSDGGLVHRVTRVFESDGGGAPSIIEVSPPLSPTFRQIVLTPQVPADIRVIRTR